MEIPQLRWPIDLLQPVEAERQQVVFQGCVKHERRACPQGSGGKEDVPCHLGLRVLGEDLAEGLLPGLLLGGNEQPLVIRQAAPMASQFQVGLGLAVQVAF